MDELVKRLREPCQYENCILCQQAADAIEELQKRVPPVPHGRLIDADALLKKCEFVCTDDDVDVRAVRYSVIEAAPTIIPAIEEGET